MSYKVRPATREELAYVVEWAAKEGWNPGLYDADAFYASDPNGYLMGFLDGEPIASLSAVSYGPDFGFLGFYIVKPEHRGKGFGLKLWQEAIKYLNTQNIGLDGVVAQQENYKKSGFTLAYSNIRYEGVGSNKVKPLSDIVPVNNIPFDQLLRYDRQFFPADRERFLKEWIKQPKSLSLGFVKNNTLMGYGVVRKCRVGYKVGPLFADKAEIADELFQQFRAFVGKETIYLDVPEVNKEAVALAKRNGMEPMFETARMYTKAPPSLPLERIFGVTTFEIG